LIDEENKLCTRFGVSKSVVRECHCTLIDQNRVQNSSTISMAICILYFHIALLIPILCP
jgi:hypothetical protein